MAIEDGEIITHKQRGACVVINVLYMLGVFMGANLRVVSTGEEFFESEQHLIVGV
jgi:hypothetical protein